MKPRNQVKRYETSHIERPKYGSSIHYWPEKMLPFVISAACIQVVLDNSEDAKPIYNKGVEAWGRRDCQAAIKDVKIPPSSIRAAIKAVLSDKISDWNDPLEDVYQKYKDSKDFKYLIGQINEFIKVGFNPKVDKEKGIYKVIPSQEHWLFFTIFIKTLVDFAASKSDFEHNRIVSVADQLFDPAMFMSGIHSNRKYRLHVSYYKNFGWRLRHDIKIMESAWRWYQCRVVCSNVVDFCNKQAEEKIILESNNIYKEIQPFDEAIGYGRRVKSK